MGQPVAMGESRAASVGCARVECLACGGGYQATELGATREPAADQAGVGGHADQCPARQAGGKRTLGGAYSDKAGFGINTATTRQTPKDRGAMKMTPDPFSSRPLFFPDPFSSPVNQPLTKQELEAMRVSAQRGRPVGSERWVARTAAKLGLESTLRPRGRPRKAEEP